MPQPCCQRRTAPPARAHGFTMVELVLVVAILGVVAALALPRFLDLRREARIGAVQGMEAAVRASLSMVYAKCAVSPSCNVNQAYYSAMAPTVVINGVTHRLQYGHPWDDYTGVGGGLPALVRNKGFVDLHHWSTNRGTHMALVGAPDPKTCVVSYRMPNAPGEAPNITVTTSGC